MVICVECHGFQLNARNKQLMSISGLNKRTSASIHGGKGDKEDEDNEYFDLNFNDFSRPKGQGQAGTKPLKAYVALTQAQAHKAHKHTKHTSTQAHKHTSTQAHKHTSTQAHKHTSTQAHKHKHKLHVCL